jgi:hypothetical protein
MLEMELGTKCDDDVIGVPRRQADVSRRPEATVRTSSRTSIYTWTLAA